MNMTAIGWSKSSASRAPAMMRGLAMFIGYVFETWPFHKLFMEVPAYNMRQFESGLGRYFTVEGQLRDRLWLQGRHWDLFVLALAREQWDEHGPRILAASRLGVDFELDSLAVSELAAFAFERFGVDPLAFPDLGLLNTMTLSELFGRWSGQRLGDYPTTVSSETLLRTRHPHRD